MVAKCNGREALELLVEHDHGYHQEYSEAELEYLRKQEKGLYVFLRKSGKSKHETEEILDCIKKSVIFEITHDWQDTFRVSQKRLNVLDDANQGISFEIDLLTANSERSQEELFDDEHKWEQYWDERLDAAAERAENKNPDEYWAKAKARMELMDIILQSLENRYPDGQKVSKDDEEFLNYLTFKLRMLRGLMRPWEQTKNQMISFKDKNGQMQEKLVRVQHLQTPTNDGVFISANMWKGTMNRINRLLNKDKRYPVKIVRETEDEIMEVPGLIVYGLDIEKCIAEEVEVDPDNE